MDEIIVYCQSKYTLLVRGSALVVVHKKDEESFPISNIQSFNIKKPGLMGFGSITFRTAQAASVGVNLGMGVSAALGAEHTYMFNSDEYQNACKLRDYILGFSSTPAPAVQAPEPSGKQVVSVVEEIRGLKELLDEGILTQEEFDAKKKQLLGI